MKRLLQVHPKPATNTQRAPAAGFTLIELVLVLAIFSFVTMLVSVGFMNVMRGYQASATALRTHQEARSALEEMVRTARVSNGVNVTGSDRICFQGPNVEYFADEGALKKQTFSGTCANIATTGDVTPVTSDDVRLASLELDEVNNAAGSMVGATIGVLITSPDPAGDLLEDDKCIPSAPGHQYCSSTYFKTSVALRGQN